MDFSSLRNGLVPAETVPPHPWDGFLTGPENDLAHASVLALARGDYAGLSPLVLHGPAGGGKSRLLGGPGGRGGVRAPGAGGGGPGGGGGAPGLARGARGA